MAAAESRREDEEGSGRRPETMVPIREARKSSKNSRQKSSFASSIKRKKKYKEQAGTQAEGRDGKATPSFPSLLESDLAW